MKEVNKLAFRYWMFFMFLSVGCVFAGYSKNFWTITVWVALTTLLYTLMSYLLSVELFQEDSSQETAISRVEDSE